ncbi:MAG TPA: ABC transporter permease, partial [Chroococcales cyanobacterium]
IIGKLLPFIASALIATSVGLAFAKFWFHIPVRGNLWTLFFFTVIFLFTSSGLGILLSAISQSKMQAMFMAFFFMMTLMMMSGFFAPVENSPPIIEMISRINPMRYYITVCRELIIKGTPFHLLLNEFWTLVFSGIVVLGSGIALQRKRSG